MPVDINKPRTNANTEQPNEITQFIYDWAASNIFLFRRWDGICYLFLYILIPVVLSFVGLFGSSNDSSLANCYLSIIINALNCLYDVFGRWEDNMPKKKLKLILILCSCVIVIAYGLLRLAAILSGNILLFKLDIILCLYSPAILVAIPDIFALFCENKALIEMIED